MKLVCKIACVALLMNALPGFGQERVFYKTVQVDGLNIFYREARPANAPAILLLDGPAARHRWLFTSYLKCLRRRTGHPSKVPIISPKVLQANRLVVSVVETRDNQ